MTWEPFIGAVVVVTQEDSAVVGDVGEVVNIMPGAIGVRIVQEESAFANQIVYFNAGQLELVPLGR